MSAFTLLRATGKTCPLYGQACTTSAECGNGIPCRDQREPRPDQGETCADQRETWTARLDP